MQTLKELKEKVQQFLETEFEDKDGEVCGLPELRFRNVVLAKAEELGLDVELVDNYGGEGKGEEYWSVYSFTDGTDTVYVQFDGWYSSYSGSKYTDWFFVQPKQVTVTQFEQEND